MNHSVGTGIRQGYSRSLLFFNMELKAMSNSTRKDRKGSDLIIYPEKNKRIKM